MWNLAKVGDIGNMTIPCTTRIVVLKAHPILLWGGLFYFYRIISVKNNLYITNIRISRYMFDC